VTLTDGLERCLKKGGAEEQTVAATCIGLLLIQLGSNPESEMLFKEVRPQLNTIMADTSRSPKVRASVRQLKPEDIFVYTVWHCNIIRKWNYWQSSFYLFQCAQTLAIGSFIASEELEVSHLAVLFTIINQQRLILPNQQWNHVIQVSCPINKRQLSVLSVLIFIMKDNVVAFPVTKLFYTFSQASSTFCNSI